MSIKLTNIIIDKLHIYDFTINLTLEDINYLNLLIQISPQIFDYIELQIRQININNKIKYYELPNIILCIASLLKKDVLKNDIKNINLINIIKFIIDTSIVLVPLRNEDTYIIKVVIESSLKLLIFELKTYEQNKRYNCMCF
uniref:Uncharacterized protein n=1 Tax=viral metagenome TaxID=1070528 RepID=A0A6C0H8S7_9ZZZZ